MKKQNIIILAVFGLAFAKLIAGIYQPISRTATERSKEQFVLEDSASRIAPAIITSPIIDFDAYMKLAAAVQRIRKMRLISLDTFMRWGQQEHVVILDTRSDSLYQAKHIKGAIHLNFADFTQDALYTLIPDTNTRILIYCNNNFKDITALGAFREPDYFTSKALRPRSIRLDAIAPAKPVSLALNIPTFINLLGYGYPNVYELGEQVYVSDRRLQFEGSAVSE